MEALVSIIQVRRIHIPLECLSKVRVELSSKIVIIC